MNIVDPAWIEQLPIFRPSTPGPTMPGAAAILASAGGTAVDDIAATLRDTGTSDWVDTADSLEEPLRNVADENIFAPTWGDSTGTPTDDSPTVAITPPSAPVSGTVAFTATASDDQAVVSVTFTLGGSTIDAVSDGPGGWSEDMERRGQNTIPGARHVPRGILEWWACPSSPFLPSGRSLRSLRTSRGDLLRSRWEWSAPRGGFAESGLPRCRDGRRRLHGLGGG